MDVSKHKVAVDGYVEEGNLHDTHDDQQFGNNPDNGGTPAKDIMKMNMATAMNGSRLAKPPSDSNV